MFPTDFTPEHIDALHHERSHHPHPRVRESMEAVYLRSHGPLPRVGQQHPDRRGQGAV